MKLIENGTGKLGTIILAHGAGAGADHPFMTHFAESFAQIGFKVFRFNFPYMQKRQIDGKKRPPDRAPRLIEAYLEVIDKVKKSQRPLIIGGKSMGGRIASMVAASDAAQSVDGLVCLGYPFHPPGKQEKPRTDHFREITLPVLFAQGERDPFGGREFVATIKLPDNFQLHWAPDGNHDLAPRKASGHTTEDNWKSAINSITDFSSSL